MEARITWASSLFESLKLYPSPLTVSYVTDSKKQEDLS